MLSIPDMAMLGAAALIFFGPEQLPKVARKVGLVVREVQNTSQSFIREMEAAAERPEASADISRAHLLEEPLATNGVAPEPAYEPVPEHDVPPPPHPPAGTSADADLPP
jgi:sec-independent protein translocase protein TatA